MTLASVILVFTACQKAKLDKSTTTSADNASAEMAFADVFKVADEVARVDDEENKSANQSGPKALYSFGTCATITVTPAWPDTTFPKTYEIDFGTTNCTGTDHRRRRGKLIGTITDRYRNPGAVLTVIPQDYYVNDTKVEGTKTITNNGRNAANNLNFTVDVADGRITNTDGDVVEWASNRTNEWISGEATILNPWDDVYSITGEGNGVNKNGRAFTVIITNALIKQIGCRWLKSGTMELKPEDLSTRTIDYGNGACDNEASVEINGRTYYFHMW